jgi:hypothetical protein
MKNFYDWKEILAMKGLRDQVMAYALAEAPEYLEEGPDGMKVLSDDEYPYVLGRAIKKKGECVFYFSRGADDQIQDHAHYRFAGKYFECDGAGQIGGPYDDNNADIILDSRTPMRPASWRALSPAPRFRSAATSPTITSSNSAPASCPLTNKLKSMVHCMSGGPKD